MHIPFGMFNSGRDIRAKVGTFTWTTAAAGNNIAVTGLGFQPKAVIFFGVFVGTTDTTNSGNLRRSMGFATSSSDRRCVAMVTFNGGASSNVDNKYSDDACVQFFSSTGTIESSLDFVSMDADGFTVAIDLAQTTARSVGYIALGGGSLTNAAGGTLTEPGATGNQDITTPGFQPDFVMFLFNDLSSTTIGAGGPQAMGAMNGAEQFVGWANEPNAQATMSLSRYLSYSQALTDAPDSGSLTMAASFGAWLSNGFRLNYSARSGSRLVPHLSLKGVRTKIGSFQTRTDGTNIQVTGLGFTPKAVIFFGLNMAESTLNTPSLGDILTSMGAASGPADRFAIGYRALHNSASSQNAYTNQHSEAYAMPSTDSSTTPSAFMDLVSMDADGFTCVMDDVDNAANTVTYIAFG